MEGLGMTAGEFAEAFKSPDAKNEKESREYIESFYDKAIANPGQYIKATIDECINRLDCLFKSYKHDSEFNYQLNVSNSPWNLLKKYITEAGLLTSID